MSGVVVQSVYVRKKIHKVKDKYLVKIFGYSPDQARSQERYVMWNQYYLEGFSGGSGGPTNLYHEGCKNLSAISTENCFMNLFIHFLHPF